MSATNGTFASHIRDAANRFVARRFVPVPVRFGTKKPNLMDGWERLRIEPASPAEVRFDLDVHFPATEKRNIGIVLGEASGGLVDADLDCREARIAAEYLMPPTGMAWGRRSAPDSHLGYVVDRPPAKAKDEYVDPTNPKRGKHGGLLLELRSTGGQTVVPPSLYAADAEGGTPEEFSVWGRDGDPARIGLEDLLRAVRRTAAAALLARHWPTGNRHDAALAVSGGLLRAGWSAEDVTIFLTAVTRAANDDEVEDRLRCVADTARRLEAQDKKVLGWPGFVKLLGRNGEAIVTRVRDWLGLYDKHRSNGRGSNIRDSRDGFPWKCPTPLPTMPPVPAFPLHLFPPGIADYWTAAAASLHVPVDLVAVPGIALLGAAAGRAVAAEVKRTYKEPPLNWMAVVYPPGGGKSPALGFAAGPLTAIGARWRAEFDEQMRTYKANKLRYEEDLKEWKRGDREACPPDEPVMPILRQLVFTNFTVDALVRGNGYNPRGIAISKDELSGLVAALNQFRAGKGDDRQNLLSMWAGAGATINREGDRKAGIPPLVIPNTFLAVAGMIQPDLLGEFRGDASRDDFKNDGWADRFLLSYPDPYPLVGETWATVPEGLEAGYVRVFETLLEMEMVPIEDAEGTVTGHRPYYVPFAADAEVAWEAFTKGIADRANALDRQDPYIGVLSKFRQHGLRLVALFHVLDLATGVATRTDRISGATVRKAADLVAYFEAHGKRALGIGYADRRSRVAKRLVNWLARNPDKFVFSRSDAYLQLKDGRDVPSSDKLDPVFRLLEDHRYIRPATGGGFHRGPVPEVYEVNPEWIRGDDSDPDSVDAAPDDFPPPPSEPVPEVPNIEPDSEGRASNIRDSGDGFGGEGDKTDSASDPSPSHITDADGVNRLAADIAEWGAPVALDTETTGLDPERDRVRLIQLCVNGGVFVIDVFAFPDPKAALAALFAALATVEVVGHNLTAFDLPFLARLGFAAATVFDTAVASRVVYAGKNLPHGLGDVLRRELNVAVDKSAQKSDWSRRDLTPAQLAYAAADVAFLIPLADALRAKATAAGLAPVLGLEMAAALPLAALAARGVGFDVQAWLALTADAKSARDRLVEELDRLAPNAATLTRTRNWNKPAEVLAAFRQFQVELPDSSEGTLAAVDHPLASVVLAYREAAQRVQAFGRKWAQKHDRDGRVFATWNLTGAKTGRMSCSGPNLQQVPRAAGYRQCFVAAPGHVLVKCDFSQIELRIAAKVTGDAAMAAAYRDGLDLHRMTAAAFLGVGEQDVTKDARSAAKIVNFGAIYGMSPKGLRRKARTEYGRDVSLDEARRFLGAFFARFPDVARWHARLKRSQATHVATLAGRRIAVERDQFYGAKANFIVQGTGGDGLKRALVLLHERRAECPNARPVLAVHDEVVVEVPEAEAESARDWLCRCMVDGMRTLIDPVPVEVEASIGRTWGG